MESWLSRLEALYNDYIGTVQELERNRKPGEGLFGMRSGPKDNPCHERFSEDVEKMLKDFRDTSPTSMSAPGQRRLVSVDLPTPLGPARTVVFPFIRARISSTPSPLRILAVITWQPQFL